MRVRDLAAFVAGALTVFAVGTAIAGLWWAIVMNVLLLASMVALWLGERRKSPW